MNYLESIPPRPTYHINEVVEWTDSRRVVLDDGSVVKAEQVDHGNHWTSYENGRPIIDPEAAAVIRAIESTLALYVEDVGTRSSLAVEPNHTASD